MTEIFGVRVRDAHNESAAMRRYPPVASLSASADGMYLAGQHDMNEMASRFIIGLIVDTGERKVEHGAERAEQPAHRR